AEDGHNTVLTVYIVACLVLFVALRKMSVVLIALCLLVMLGSQVYASQKFDWRQAYIENAIAGKPFPLEEMITTYPTFEQHMFKFLKAPDWVRFNSECIQPALNNLPGNADCKTPEAIMLRYNIDILESMRQLTAKMQNTAKLLESGQMAKRSQYVDCIAQKNCVSIPLLPKGVDAEKMDPMSKDYLEIRQAFWSLIKDKKMSKETCNLTPMCRALVNLNIVKADSLPF
ncbi:MAG TPA: hypothetical protein VIN59_04470, partial [Alphaproteobacteria bacterium]